MILAILILTAFVTPVLVASVIVWSDPGSVLERVAAGRWATRLARARDALVAELSPTATAFAILLAGSSVIVAICWPLGTIAKALETQLDVPLFEWMQARLAPADPWTATATLLTQVGDLTDIAAIALVAALFFALLWRRRRWWLPPVMLGIAVAAEVVLQRVLALLVDRGHPPTALGTYPSGGTARVLGVFGVVFFLVLLARPSISRRWRAVGWTTVALLGALEGFTRFYLLQHWTTDVIAGWVFGGLLLLVIIAAASAITRTETAAAALTLPD